MSFRFCPPPGAHRHPMHPPPARSLFHANKYRLIPVFRRPKSYTLRQILSVRPTAHPPPEAAGAAPGRKSARRSRRNGRPGTLRSGSGETASRRIRPPPQPGLAYPDKKRLQMYEFAPMAAVISVSLFPFGRHRPGEYPDLRPPRATPGSGPRPDTAQTNGTNNPK